MSKFYFEMDEMIQCAQLTGKDLYTDDLRSCSVIILHNKNTTETTVYHLPAGLIEERKDFLAEQIKEFNPQKTDVFLALGIDPSGVTKDDMYYLKDTLCNEYHVSIIYNGHQIKMDSIPFASGSGALGGALFDDVETGSMQLSIKMESGSISFDTGEKNTKDYANIKNCNTAGVYYTNGMHRQGVLHPMKKFKEITGVF